MAPLVSKLLWKQNIPTVLERLVDFLCWTQVALFMLLTKLDLRPYLGSRHMKKLLRSGPAKISPLSEDLNLKHFYTVPRDDFWNSVALLKRDDRFPSTPMGFGRVLIGKLWNNWNYDWSYKTIKRLRTAEFNPRHNLVAIVYETVGKNNMLVCHPYGVGNQVSCQILCTEDPLAISWSKEGSYLLVKRQSRIRSVLNFFRVSDDGSSIVRLRNMQLGTKPHTVTAQLWLTDNAFLFPGVGERADTPTRPWIYEIQDGGENLLIRQPEKRLRTEFQSKKENRSPRGLLTALDNGYSCEISICRPPEARRLISYAHCQHSVIHFYDCNQNASKELFLPGIFQCLTSKNEKVYIVYRENSSMSFYSKVPLVLDPVKKCKKRKKSTPAKRRPRFKLNTPPNRLFFNHLPRLKCVQTSSRHHPTSDSDSSSSSSSNSRNKNSGQKKCPLCTDWFHHTKRLVQVALCVFNTETNQLEIETLTQNSYVLGQLPNEINIRHPFDSTQDLEELANKTGVMSVSENLIFVRFFELNSASASNISMQLHLGNPSNGWKNHSSQRHVFMHPTKNIFLQLSDIDKCTFPLTLHSCPDLLTDFQAFLTPSPLLMGQPGILLKQLTFVVTDENGEQISSQNIRASLN